MIRSRSNKLRECCIADTARRKVYDTLEGLLVVRINDQAQVRQYILHLLALVERQSAVDSVRNAAFAHRLLKYTRLSIGAIKDSTIGVVIMLQMQIADLSGNHICLFIIGIRTQNVEFATCLLL